MAIGARIVEKHFTIAKDFSDFRDHRLSADPAEFAQLVRRIAEVETLLGDGVKSPRPCEEGTRTAARRSIVAARDLTPGTVLTRADLDWLRPGIGLSPAREGEVVGRALVRPYAAGEAIRIEDLGGPTE